MALDVLAPEARLLFVLNRPDGGAAVRALAAAGLDWTLVAKFAERECAGTAAARCAQALGVPAPEAAALARLARVTEFRMRYLQQRLAESVGALERAGIPCLLLKGAALGSTVYRSFADRAMVDLDVLVHAEHAEAAVDALVAGGGWAWRPDRDREDNYAAVHHMPALLDARGVNVSLELHKHSVWSGNPFGLTTAELFAASRAAPGALAWARVPDPLHSLVHVCVHFAWSHLLRSHAWRALSDVRALLTAEPPDWNRLLALAARLRAVTSCYWTLRLARDLMGVEIPDRVLRALRPPLPELVLRGLLRHYTLTLVPTTLADCPSVRLQRLLWSLGMRPGWSGHGDARRWGEPAEEDLPSYAAAARASAARRRAPAITRAWRAAQPFARYARVMARGISAVG